MSSRLIFFNQIENRWRFIYGGTALRDAPEIGDYGGSAPVIPHSQRMRSIRTPAAAASRGAFRVI
ncbi:MAG: hypothetical protein CVV49_14670 [Spirochaetae bacterium HGW-Spirochaetae-5]|nr:MAG: hypothetical protein CVV49_14670 [Spirochaetae bacterium HGW-Spirochaetae-5]